MNDVYSKEALEKAVEVYKKNPHIRCHPEGFEVTDLRLVDNKVEIVIEIMQTPAGKKIEDLLKDGSIGFTISSDDDYNVNGVGIVNYGLHS
jgi:hypothetical protein